MGGGDKKSERGGKRGRGHVREVRIREGSSAAWYSHVALFFSLPADVCLSVRVYRRITLCKHRAFALNRQHRYSQLMFSLSGATPANHTLYWESDWESNGPFIYHGPRLHCAPCACACSYYNGPKLCVTLSHFLPFKSCFWESTSTAVTAAGWGSDLTRCGLVPNIQGAITLAKNILVNSVISVFKVRKMLLVPKCSGVTQQHVWFHTFCLLFSSFYAQRNFSSAHTEPDL